MFKLAELFVDIKARDETLQGQLASTRSDLTTWGVAVGTTLGTLAGRAIAAAGSSVAGFFADGIRGAVDLQETLSKVDAIFGDAAGAITSQADEMAAKFGVVKQEYLDAASGFGAAFKSAGLAAEESAAIGNQLAKLGMDMASFGNADNAEVFTALSAALRGETDPLERFNVMFKQADVNARAVAMGLATNKNEVSELAAKQAALNLILEKTADQQGDLERTADGSANQWRRLTGTVTNTAVELAGKLEPALNAVLKAGNAMIDGIGPGVEWLGGAFQTFADVVVEAVDVIGVIWRNLGDYWEMTTIKAEEMFANTIAIIETLPENIGRIASWIGRNWYQLIADGFHATTALFTNFGENLGNLAYAVYAFLSDPTSGFEFEWKPLLSGFEATVEALPEMVSPALVDFDERIRAVGERVESREGERAARMAARTAAAVKPDAAAPAAEDASDKFKSQLFGAADFSLKLRAAILGGDDTPRKQLAATEKIEKNTKETADAAKKPARAVFS